MKNKVFLRIAVSGFFLFFYLLSMGEILKAQTENVRLSDKQFVSKQWDNTRGLPVNTVFKVLKDKTGYIWAATEEGLVRFDGVNFRIFDQENIPGVLTPMFYDLKKASDGGVWAANANTIVYAHGNRIRAYVARTQVEGSWINTVEEIDDGSVLAGIHNGNLLRLKDGKIEFVAGWEEYKNGAVMTIEKISDGVLIGTQNGLFKYDTESGTFEEIPGYEGLEIRALLETPSGNLWIGTRSHGLFHQQRDSVIVINETVGLANNQINTIRLSDDGRIWVGMGMGGVQLIARDEITSLREIEFGFNSVNDIYITDNGNVWLSATGHGIVQMIPSDIRMLREADGLSNETTLAVYQDKEGVVWTGTPGLGMNRIENGEVTHITPDYGLEHGVVLGIYGVDDFIYLGTGYGLYRFNPETDAIDRFFTTDDGLASNIVQAIYQDSRGRVWVTSRSGGIHKLHNHQEIERVDVPDRFQSAEFISILEDRKGNIWFSTTSTGIVKLDGDDNLIGYSIHHGPSSEMVLSMYEDPEGSIWAGTNEGMLVLKDGEFKLFNRSNGLQFNGIFRMIEDEYGYLWASGNFGIQRMRVNDLLALKHDETGNMRIPVRLFDTSDGMANHEANGGVFPAGWKMNNGEIWFPTMQGVAMINPADLIRTEQAVEVHIESLRFGGNEFTITDDIVIPPGVYNLEINYGSFDYKKPHTINYSYRISALSDEWHSTGNRSTAYFTSLIPGSYNFDVKAEQFGVESDIATIFFTVEPFFYETVWFRMLILVGLFLAGYSVNKFYSKLKLGESLKKQVDEKTKELQERNQTLEAVLKDIEHQNSILKEVAWVQSHELRGPLSRMLGLIDVVKNYDQFKSIRKEKDELLNEISIAANELDGMIRKLNAEIEEFEKSDH
jgi:ligand-binding sensor domain-containing protein